MLHELADADGVLGVVTAGVFSGGLLGVAALAAAAGQTQAQRQRKGKNERCDTFGFHGMILLKMCFWLKKDPLHGLVVHTAGLI